jgi:hypothetical protein
MTQPATTIHLLGHTMTVVRSGGQWQLSCDCNAIARMLFPTVDAAFDRAFQHGKGALGAALSDS